MPALVAGIHEHRLSRIITAVVMDCRNKSGNDRRFMAGAFNPWATPP